MFIASHVDAYFSFALVCAFLFCFVSRSHLQFNPVLNSNEFAIYKKNLKIMKLSYSIRWLWAETPFSFGVSPACPLLASPVHSPDCGTAQHSPAKAHPVKRLTRLPPDSTRVKVNLVGLT
jgi:hypothetical protein